MNEGPRFGWHDGLALLLVLALAAATRAGYLLVVIDQADKVLFVQGDDLRSDKHWLGSAPYLAADPDEPSAHAAPAYPWLYHLVTRSNVELAVMMAWLQVGLGVLTVLCYFLFARWAFQSLLVAVLTGLLTALHPFWIINIAEMNDSVLASFLLAVNLTLGSHTGQRGGIFPSLLFGLTLAALAMTRAAMLPFTLVALLWFLLCCRKLRSGWFCGFLVLLGFANGLAPWTVRNFREFGEPVPIADSAFVHLWMGNAPGAKGGPLTDAELRESLRESRSEERLQQLLAETNQARRYSMLAQDVAATVRNDPTGFVERRLRAGLAFFFGETWLETGKLGKEVRASIVELGVERTFPEWPLALTQDSLPYSLFVMLLAGVLGWRFSQGWRVSGRLAALALLWIPLPYLLSHGGALSGPRLPLDGVLLTYAAFALACLWPGLQRAPADPNS